MVRDALLELHVLAHVEETVQAVLHQQARHDAEAAEGGQPHAQHVVLKEARVVGDGHGLAMRQPASRKVSERLQSLGPPLPTKGCFT